MITASAPGKIILFGEHAVVYNKIGIACTINKKFSVKISPIKEDFIVFNAKDLKVKHSLTKECLFSFLEKINDLEKNKKFEEIKEIRRKNKFPPSLFIVANILKKYGFIGMKIESESKIPKNLGSSSAAFAAISLGVLKYLGKKHSKKIVSDIAYQGDVLAHSGTPSGIDNTVVTYGGYIKYKKSEGIKPLKIDFKIPLLIVDSGQKAETAKTVSYIRKQRKEKPKRVNAILNSLNDISKRALKSLHNRDLDEMGKLMVEYYKTLKKLNVSTPKLDRIVKIAIANKALGAKPTGGWGGGCCLVLARNQRDITLLKKKFKKAGFNSFQAKIGVEGVK
ncbi:mevalonate kinase [Patescibacteria group bacterium]|nr:mevalonate kinase [Patescibacteria group bacterium]MBU1877273.1 mevalonate kinase [Patescibacteria group bacterium]